MADNDLVSEVLNRLIDSQISNTQALTSLKSTLDENNERLKDMDGFFRNGFRSDIKTILSELEDAQEERTRLKSKIESVEEFAREIKDQNRTWVRIVGILVGLGAIAAVIIKFI
jgi:DNA repair exonuclease SbcCD ATPase subunit